MAFYRIIVTLALLTTSLANSFVFAEEPAPSDPTKPKRRFLILPIAYYMPETSAALGALAILNVKKVREGRMSNILTSASYTLKQQSIFIANPKFYFNEGNVEISANIRYLFFPAEFYGRGNNTRAEDKEHFTQNIFTTDLIVKHTFHKGFFFAPFGSYQQQKIVDYEQGKLVESEMRFGYGEYVHRSLGIQIGYDTRDYINAPLSGAYYFLTSSTHWFENPHNLFPDNSYKDLELDLRQYISVGDKKVLAANFFIGKEEGSSIPFQFLNKLGGGSALRGYLSGRYRDKAMTYAQLDYRADFYEKFSYSFFTGVGVVAPNTDTLLENRRRHTVGAGVHYIIDQESRQKMRLDVGIGESDYGVYVVFSEAF